jgi:hypothetical protein
MNFGLFRTLLVVIFATACEIFPVSDPWKKCGECSLSVDTIATLHVDTGKVLLGEMSAVLEVNNAFVATSSDGSQLLRFDAAGRLVAIKGRQGYGPGEFGKISMLTPALNDGTLLAVDQGRVHHIDTALSVLTTATVAGLDCQRALDSARYLCMRNSGSLGIVIYDRRDRTTKSILELTSTEPGSCLLCQSYMLYGGDRTFVLASYNHRVFGWGSLKGLADSVEYQLPGSVYAETDVGPEPTQKPKSELSFPRGSRLWGGWSDGERNVFLVASFRRVPVEKRDAETKMVRPGSMVLTDVKPFNSAVLAFDRTGKPIGKIEFVGERIIPIGESLIAKARYDSTSFIMIDILRIRRAQ